MKAICANSPQLKGETVPYRKSLYFKGLAGSFVVVSGNEEGKHGRMPAVIVGDEMHEWRSLMVMNTLRQGTGTRLEPMELYGSTTGKKDNKVAIELWELTKAIIDGRIIDPETLAIIDAADPGADYRDEAQW